jgi:CheY-like chemotaxis protein
LEADQTSSSIFGEPVDVVLLLPPDLTKLEAVSQIKEQDAFRNACVIALAPYGGQRRAGNREVPGVDFIVAVPLRRLQLFDAVGLTPQAVVRRPPAFQPSPGSDALLPKGIRILLAEDGVVNQAVALAQLKKLGYVAEVVPDGASAVDAATEAEYDVIFMDCQMPELDGYEATRRIRSYEESHRKAHTHIIAMTAHAMEGAKEECLAAGMDSYLSKPLRIGELEAALVRFGELRAGGTHFPK